jgi:GT2 family glycosyltransferase
MITEKPATSIIIPAYNAAPFLARAVSSCTESDRYKLEIIIVNDGSTDATARIADEMAARDQRIAVVHQENRGLAEARNSGLKRVTGSNLVLLDADDELIAGWLAPAISTLESDPLLDGVYSRSYILCSDQNGTTERRTVPASLDLPNLLSDNSVPVSCFVLRTSLYRKIGLFDSRLPTHEDWHYWLRAAHAGWRLKTLDRDSCIIHAHTLNMSNNWRRMSAGRIACLTYAERHFALNAKLMRQLRGRRAMERFFVQLECVFSSDDGGAQAPVAALNSLLHALDDLPLLYRYSPFLIPVKVMVFLLLIVARLGMLLRIPYNLNLRRLLWPVRRVSYLAPRVDTNSMTGK